MTGTARQECSFVGVVQVDLVLQMFDCNGEEMNQRGYHQARKANKLGACRSFDMGFSGI
jgi:hypothetical protein